MSITGLIPLPKIYRKNVFSIFIDYKYQFRFYFIYEKICVYVFVCVLDITYMSIRVHNYILRSLATITI